MPNYKIFMDHFFFSIIGVFMALIGLYVLFYVVDGILGAWGLPLGFKNFSVGDNILIISIIWIVISLILTGVLTAISIRNRPTDSIIRSKRTQY